MVPPTNMKFQPIPSRASATMKVASTGGNIRLVATQSTASTAPAQMTGRAP
jgi:hypothetical protein